MSTVSHVIFIYFSRCESIFGHKKLWFVHFKIKLKTKTNKKASVQSNHNLSQNLTVKKEYGILQVYRIKENTMN